MPSPRLLLGLTALLASAATLALLHGCEDTPKPSEPELATAVLRTMTVSGSGTGNGVVTSSPSGINCAITAGVAAANGCQAQFTSPVAVTLTAVPASGHSFLGWSQDCTGMATCKKNMTVNRAATAQFLKGPFLVKITSASPGTGTGRIRTQSGLTPAINCLITNGTVPSTGCSATYPAYTEVTLTAVPSAGYLFAGWPEPTCGTGKCLYPIIQALTVPVAFSAIGSSNAAVQGRWEPAFTTPVVAVHTHMLLTGKVFFWGDTGNGELWDPANPGAGFTPVSKTHRIYCSGHSFLPDGRLLVTGGTSPGTRGLRVATVFNPSTRSWSATQPMAQGRYYPTTTTLPNGEILAVSGHDTNKTVVTIPEIWNGTTWRRLTTAPLSIPDPFYPDMFVAPNGRVFMAGFPQASSYLNTNGTGHWTTVANRKVADRRMGSAVMYAPGKILYVGGGDPPTASAEVIDLNPASPSWRTVPAMAFVRRQTNATILADGKVLVTGGTSGPGFNDQAGAVHNAELWNPATETFKTMARENSNRTYHSTAILLPDGRVLSSGSGEGGGIPFENSEFTAQIFTPPYLFTASGALATRPSITTAPTALSYQQSFLVRTPNAGSVTKGTLIRLSSVTHTFNQSQLIYPLTFAVVNSTTLRATAPGNPNVAPPGPYMLFLINSAGVPSVAQLLTVGP